MILHLVSSVLSVRFLRLFQLDLTEGLTHNLIRLVLAKYTTVQVKKMQMQMQ